MQLASVIADQLAVISWIWRCHTLNITMMILNSTQHRTGSQFNSRRTDVVCFRWPVPAISLAVTFWTDWTVSVGYWWNANNIKVLRWNWCVRCLTRWQHCYVWLRWRITSSCWVMCSGARQVLQSGQVVTFSLFLLFTQVMICQLAGAMFYWITLSPCWPLFYNLSGQLGLVHIMLVSLLWPPLR